MPLGHRCVEWIDPALVDVSVRSTFVMDEMAILEPQIPFMSCELRRGESVKEGLEVCVGGQGSVCARFAVGTQTHQVRVTQWVKF
jgi:hypothetical protein